MTQLETLIQTLCPNGVNRYKLKDIAEMQRGTSITKKNVIEGTIPVISGGKEPAYYCNTSNREADVITVAGSGAGAGYVQYWEQPIFVCDSFSVKGKQNVSTKYLYYYLTNIQESIYATKKGGGVPHVHISSIENFQIPLPPLAVQSEIVRILDKFTLYKSELAAELAARLQQYEYYRNRLLTFDDSVKRVKLGEVGEFIRGNGLQKKDFVDEGFPCIHYGQIHTYYGTFTTKTKSFVANPLYSKLKKAHTGDLIIATTSEDAEGVCKAVAWLGKEDVAVSGDAYIFRHSQNPKYMAYLFQTEQFLKYKKKAATGTKVVRVSGESMAKFEFPLPSLEVQERIVSILDRFDALCHDIREGLPAEIDLRQKQYEHYRDKLLTFEAKG